MSSERPGEQEEQDEIPTAIVNDWRESVTKIFKSPALRSTKMWWLTIGCAIVAILLVFSSIGSKGKKITIRFQDGHGVKPHDTLRFRGIDVGEITAVEMDDALNAVAVTIQLVPNADQIAREGSRFWIERPQIGLSRVSGLETVVGAKYIGVIPGSENAKPQTTFEGVESPPVLRESSFQEITVRFQDGRGLQSGSVVKHRGIIVGEVTAVELDTELEGVTVAIRLAENASGLARAGTQFWIERPRLSVGEIRGLDTLVSGRYIAVAPGLAQAESLSHFEGLETAPPASRSEGGLEVILESPQRWGLEPDAPLTYRGLQVGHVISVRLASDAAGLEARVFIEPDYKSLVRDNTRFWSTSGFDVDFGFTGVQLSAETLSTIAAGGVAFATSDPPGQTVSTGYRFSFQEDSEDEWLTWQPRISVGAKLLPEGRQLPELQRATLRWNEKTLGFTRAKQRQGWVLPLDNGKLLGLAEFLSFPDRAVGEVNLELAGQQLVFDKSQTKRAGHVSYFNAEGKINSTMWAASDIREAQQPEDCLLVGDPLKKSMPLSAGRVTTEDDYWMVDRSVSLNEDWNGASVISVHDGKLIGLVRFEKGLAYVAKISASSAE